MSEVKSEVENGKAPAVPGSTPVAVSPPALAAPSQEPVKKTVLPQGSRAPIPLGEGIADKVGKILDAKHLSKDRIIVERHARFKSDHERVAFAVCRSVVNMIENFAVNENPDNYYAAIGKAKLLEDDGDSKSHGWSLANEYMMKDTNLLLARGIYGPFLDHYANISHADGGAAADSVEVVAGKFGSQEAEAGKMDKLKTMFGRGGGK